MRDDAEWPPDTDALEEHLGQWGDDLWDHGGHHRAGLRWWWARAFQGIV